MGALIPDADQGQRCRYFFVWPEPVEVVVPVLELFFPLFTSDLGGFGSPP